MRANPNYLIAIAIAFGTACSAENFRRSKTSSEKNTDPTSNEPVDGTTTEVGTDTGGSESKDTDDEIQTENQGVESTDVTSENPAGLSYTYNKGAIKTIKWKQHVLTTGGAYNSVLSCDGPDDQDTNGESGQGTGIYLTNKGTLPACGSIPYVMTFSGVNQIDATIKIGPFAGPTAIVSLALDLDKPHTADFEFLGSTELGWTEGCGYSEEGTWRTVSSGTRGRYAEINPSCLIHNEHPVALAKRAATEGLILRARGLQADISRTIKKITLRDAAGNPVSAADMMLDIQAAFFSHPGTNSIAIEILPKRSAGRIPTGYSLEIEETITAYDPSVAPGDLFTCGRLQSDQKLMRGQFVDSCDGGTRLWHQIDGNVVLYKIPSLEALWQTNTANSATSKFHMQSDGNLVLMNGRGDTALFQSGTYANPGAYALIQNNNDLVIYSVSNTALWRVGP